MKKSENTYAPVAAALAAGGASSEGATSAPGRTFCTPSTITRSPSSRPDSMIQRVS
jgi:hypothetical protein